MKLIKTPPHCWAFLKTYLVYTIGLLGLLLLPLCFSPAVFARDKENPPIYIDSDTAAFNEKTNIGTYTGNVVYTQGSLVVHSDVMTFHLSNGVISKIVVTGKPATFKQNLGGEKDDVNGRALTAEYYPSTAKLFLMKEAVVWQGGNKSSSDLIIYDTKNSLIQAGDTKTSTKRVHTVFEPKKE